MELTEKEFCKAYTAFYGEEITSIAQIQLNRSTGQEMFEFVEGLVKNLTLPVVIDWVAVKDEKPPVRTRVLVTDGRIITEAHTNARNGYFEGYTLLDGEYLDEVIMWAHKPKPPCL